MLVGPEIDAGAGGNPLITNDFVGLSPQPFSCFTVSVPVV